MKKYRAYGVINVIVETFVEIPDDVEPTLEEIYDKAHENIQADIDNLFATIDESDSLQAEEDIDLTYMEVT